MSKFEKLFQNDAPARPGQRTKYLYEAYKNEVIPNDAHINNRASGSA